MKTSIISIGNSKGIRIPKVLLEESGIGKTVELKVRRGEIKIVAVPTTPAPKHQFNDEYLLSLKTLSDWNNPEEDRALASLQ